MYEQKIINAKEAYDKLFNETENLIDNNKLSDPQRIKNKLKELQKLYQLDYGNKPQDLTNKIKGLLSSNKDQVSQKIESLDVSFHQYEVQEIKKQLSDWDELLEEQNEEFQETIARNDEMKKQQALRSFDRNESTAMWKNVSKVIDQQNKIELEKIINEKVQKMAETVTQFTEIYDLEEVEKLAKFMTLFNDKEGYPDP